MAEWLLTRLASNDKISAPYTSGAWKEFAEHDGAEMSPTPKMRMLVKSKMRGKVENAEHR